MLIGRLLIIAALSLGLASCGDDIPSPEDAASQASDLAQRTNQLAGDVADELESELPPNARQDLEALRDNLQSQTP